MSGEEITPAQLDEIGMIRVFAMTEKGGEASAVVVFAFPEAGGGEACNFAFQVGPQIAERIGSELARGLRKVGSAEGTWSAGLIGTILYRAMMRAAGCHVETADTPEATRAAAKLAVPGRTPITPRAFAVEPGEREIAYNDAEPAPKECQS